MAVSDHINDVQRLQPQRTRGALRVNAMVTFLNTSYLICHGRRKEFLQNNGSFSFVAWQTRREILKRNWNWWASTEFAAA